MVFFASFFRNISKTAETILIKKIERNHGISVYKKALISEHRKNYIFRDNNCRLHFMRLFFKIYNIYCVRISLFWVTIIFHVFYILCTLIYKNIKVGRFFNPLQYILLKWIVHSNKSSQQHWMCTLEYFLNTCSNHKSCQHKFVNRYEIFFLLSFLTNIQKKS